MATAAEPQTLAEFAIARSLVLDAFAHLEQSVADVFKIAGLAFSHTAPLGQKLELLKTLKPSTRLSKAHAKTISDFVQAAEQLLSVRNDIVHSAVTVVLSPKPAAIYRNTATCCDDYPVVRALDINQHRNLAREVSALATKINPPLPPRPSPVATGDP